MTNYCEIRLEVPGNDHFVKKNGHYFEISVNECVDVLTQMINKTKDMHTDRRHAKTIKVQDALLTNELNDDEVELEDVIK